MSYATWLCAPAITVAAIVAVLCIVTGEWAGLLPSGTFIIGIGSLCLVLRRMGY